MSTESRYLQTLIKDVMDSSESNSWESAVTEWEISDVEEDESLEESCICGKEQLFKLLHAVEENQFLQLSSEFFSRKLLLYLYEIGAFKPTKWNDFQPEKDYKFMLDMFNKRTRTDKQDKKATAIILGSIKPFLQVELAGKVKR